MIMFMNRTFLNDCLKISSTHQFTLLKLGTQHFQKQFVTIENSNLVFFLTNLLLWYYESEIQSYTGSTPEQIRANISLVWKNLYQFSFTLFFFLTFSVSDSNTYISFQPFFSLLKYNIFASYLSQSMIQGQKFCNLLMVTRTKFLFRRPRSVRLLNYLAPPSSSEIVASCFLSSSKQVRGA